MKAPVWSTIVAVAACLPLLAMPWLLSVSDPSETNRIMLCLYPLAVVLGAYCARKSMPERPEVFWILIAIILLIHASMWILVDPLLLRP